METAQKKQITVDTTVRASLEEAWKCWTEPESITKWCQASDDWHAPYAENDPRTGGAFKTTMAAKDGSMSFDFEGVYTNVVPKALIEYEMSDGRKASIMFTPQGDSTRVVETFDAESTNPVEMQRDGWQAILDSFRKYVEGN